MSFRADRIYLEFLRLTRRLSNQQIMMLLAVVAFGKPYCPYDCRGK